MKKFGFVFPGQGSQKLGMLRELATEFDIIEKTFAEGSAELDLDLWQIAQLDAENKLDLTHITQPILLSASVAIWRAWNQLDGPQPSILAGHSLGEYSALVCAGVLEFREAVKIVFHRGKFMQAAAPAGNGKMAAIVGLENHQINSLCAEASGNEVVSAANFNSPGQTVIAGHSIAVDRAIELCRAAGAKRALPLNVSVPSHCALMKPAADQLAQTLSTIRFSTAAIPVVQNVNAEISGSPEDIRLNLIRQLYEPVQWVDSIRLLHKAGISKLVECGPGKVLSGLVKRIEPEIACFGSDDGISLKNAIAEMAT